ncbi:MAG TPA: hypothetical protein PLY93_14435, partial [Turneriella sp.]|nr:hypothetical protein [Turneriella sp.]
AYDQEVIDLCHHLTKHEGLFVGSSAALNVAGALRLAKNAKVGSTLVTILCDGGGRYQSRLYNDAWLKEKNFIPRTVDAAWLSSLT